jgi:hypothetical protein
MALPGCAARRGWFEFSALSDVALLKCYNYFENPFIAVAAGGGGEEEASKQDKQAAAAQWHRLKAKRAKFTWATKLKFSTTIQYHRERSASLRGGVFQPITALLAPSHHTLSQRSRH